MIRFLLLLFGLLSSQILLAQSSLFLPRNLEKNYREGTRSADGKPGAKYWQNRASYNIKASLEPKTLLLSGEETVTYVNNSPDTLKNIRFKLQHDRYRKGAQRSGDVTPSDVTDEGVRVENIIYNGTEVAKDKQSRRATWLDLDVKQTPLPPGASATISMRWSYTLPAGEDASRECVCDSTTFFVPYWYPQIAVYDDIRGWASFPYTGQQEFYHDFADYDVTFTMPRGFMVWATGELQNAEDVLNKKYFERFQKAQKSDEVVSVFTEKELQEGGVFKKRDRQTFHFVAKDVPDFAFASSDHFNWDALSVVVDDKTGRRTFVQAAYNTDSKDYYRVAGIAAKGIRLMSTWLPGYPFPYPSMTVFNGNDGMEYPMMCNDASQGDRDPTGLTVHEVSHTYFPFMMGINEQEYAWMDEGWASTFDMLLTDSLNNTKNARTRGYAFVAGTDNDVPPMVLSKNLGSAYRNASYSRPQAAYLGLLDLLGYETFHKCMVEYMDRWKGKHPIPQDFFNTWNNVSGQNLDWYWKPWFFEWGYPDLGIGGVEKNEAANASVIIVNRLGNIPIPIHMEIEYADETKQTVHEKSSVWKDGKSQWRYTAPAGKTVKTVTLGANTIPDTNKENNK